MSDPILHYIYDPLCGWCYGAAPLVKMARDIIEVQPHGGGMMAGEHRQAVTPPLRAFVQHHDDRIAHLTGQPFGDNYFDGLLCDASAVFDSEPPTAAMLAAQIIAGRGLDMLAQLQIAHYVEGRRIADHTTLIEVATETGIEPIAFKKELDRQTGGAVQAHIRETQALMARMGTQIFPSFVLQTGNDFTRLDAARYLGKPEEFQGWLRNILNASIPLQAFAA